VALDPHSPLTWTSKVQLSAKNQGNNSNNISNNNNSDDDERPLLTGNSHFGLVEGQGFSDDNQGMEGSKRRVKRILFKNLKFISIYFI